MPNLWLPILNFQLICYHVPFRYSFALAFNTMTEYIKIGKFVSTFGVKGELVLKHNLGKKTALKGLQALFIEERKERFIPWFVQSIRIKSADEVYVQLADVATREAALKLVQKEVWATETDFKTFAAKSSPINLLGYTIV